MKCLWSINFLAWWHEFSSLKNANLNIKRVFSFNKQAFRRSKFEANTHKVKFKWNEENSKANGRSNNTNLKFFKRKICLLIADSRFER